MKDLLLRFREHVAFRWTHFRFDIGLGPAPWEHLECIKTIESRGQRSVKVFRSSRCFSNYLIDLRFDGAVPSTIAVFRSQDLDEVLELLRDARAAISLADHCDD